MSQAVRAPVERIYYRLVRSSNVDVRGRVAGVPAADGDV